MLFLARALKLDSDITRRGVEAVFSELVLAIVFDCAVY